jgi:hypothetical protein
MVEMLLALIAEAGIEDLNACEELLDLRERFPPNENFKFAQSNGDLGLVVCVSEFLRIFLVNFGGQFFVRVDLEGKCFRNGENLRLL